MNEMITQFFYDAFLAEGIFIIIVAYVLGDIIKKATPLNNQLITLIVPVVAGTIAVFTPFIEGDLIVKILKGVVLGWAATGGYETIRNVASMIKTNAANKENNEVK